jgi:hypothetical protein
MQWRNPALDEFDEEVDVEYGNPPPQVADLDYFSVWVAELEEGGGVAGDQFDDDMMVGAGLSPANVRGLRRSSKSAVLALMNK